MYTQVLYCLDRVPAVVAQKPELKDKEPFKTVMSGDRKAIAKLSIKDLDFVRVYADQTYGIPPEQVVGTAGGTTYGYDKDGRPFLTKDPKLLLNDNNAGKPEGIHLMIGRRPHAAFGKCWNTPK